VNEDGVHRPVLLDEVVGYLNPRPGGVYVDCTLGGGGHAREVLKVGGGIARLIGIDRDAVTLKRVRAELKSYGGIVELHHDRYENLPAILNGRPVDGILFDLGVSSFMLDDPERGFSFRTDGPLDMRMDREQSGTAADIVNGWERRELALIFKKYGEEPFASRVASAIVRAREEAQITSTLQLAEIVRRALPYKKSRTDPATRIFQALRIAVNGEVEGLERVLESGIESLAEGGRIVVISFHSLEDRVVKNSFRRLAKGCICPPRIPQCICGLTPAIKALTRKPVKASAEEVSANPRSRSALLRAAEKVAV
jgi:16S rRNA (cytosine1402-N4)-methyltransferase